MERIVLIADEGKIYTNGTVYGVEVYLVVGEDPANWYQISEEEYWAKLETEQFLD